MPDKSPITEAKTGLRGIPRMFQAVMVSWAGLRAAFQGEEAFRLEVLAGLILLPLGLLLGQGGTEKALLVGSLFLVLIVELLNSAVEAAVDRIGPEKHELSKLAKDLGSAAVLLALISACVTWALVLWG